MVSLNEPESEEDAALMAVKAILQAASHLLTAADFAEDGVAVDQYVNSAIHLRDLANSISPDKPDWPENVIPFVPRARW